MPPAFAPTKLVSTALAAVLMGASHGSVAVELEEITIIGTQASVREIAGTGAIIGSAQIRDELATDVNPTAADFGRLDVAGIVALHHLEFDGQPVAIPTRDVRRFEARHGFGTWSFHF